MNQLLADILDAHSGMNRCHGYHKVEATIVSGGGLFQLKDTRGADRRPILEMLMVSIDLSEVRFE
jgi:hypothetical protein